MLYDVLMYTQATYVLKTALMYIQSPSETHFPQEESQ